jgi:selenide,water dikinase
LIVGKADHVDLAQKTVRVPGHGMIGYDILALDVGVTSEMPQIPGFAEHVLPAKPLDRLADGWERFAKRAPDGAHIAVIGGGVAGAELALAARHRLRAVSPKVTLVERQEALTALPKHGARAMRDALDAAGVTASEGTAVAEVKTGEIVLEDGRSLKFDCAIGAAGARPHDWIAEIGARTENGYLVVDEYLRSVDDPCVYASGDCAHLAHAPRPKAGVFAVRAAPVLAHNLKADLTGGQRRRFEPQKDYLKLISLGGKVAFGEKAGVRVKGAVGPPAGLATVRVRWKQP